ncbi:hypothetical protein FQR65_LT06640 [Abscondita terminalis]|nr:hypothetical protein FQR65_LT06640 [Abscondita terminalis]
MTIFAVIISCVRSLRLPTMFIKLALVSCAVVACLAQDGGYGHGGSSYASHSLGHDHGHHESHSHGHDHGHHVDYYAHPKYHYKYGVSDHHTHDIHSQHESRDGDSVHGEYSLHEPDGTIRVVKYTADHKNGFNAEVIRKGHAQHPETHVKHAFKFALISCAVVACFAQHGSYGHEASSYASHSLGNDHGHHQISHNQGHDHGHHVDYYAHPKYHFKYGVSDHHTHDHHSQQESRDGDAVHGEYSLHESDGTIRVVKYTADHKNGFNAEVIRKGHAKHPETHVKHAFVAHAHHDKHEHHSHY